jgi:hypothetical protein
MVWNVSHVIIPFEKVIKWRRLNILGYPKVATVASTENAPTTDYMLKLLESSGSALRWLSVGGCYLAWI